MTRPAGKAITESGGSDDAIPFDDPDQRELRHGYAILQAKSKREAIEWTKHFLLIHGEEWDLECEVRQLDEPVSETARNTAA